MDRRCALAATCLLVSLGVPGTGAAQLSRGEATEALEAHNRWRAVHRALPLAWSEDLARYAQAWAETLVARHPGELLHSADASGPRPAALALGYRNWGENLYWSSALLWSDGRREARRDLTAGEVVDSWAAEDRWWRFTEGACAAPPGETCGHFTQVVWAATTHVGCGRAFGADSAQVWACSYDPPGNFLGEHTANVLPPTRR